MNDLDLDYPLPDGRHLDSIRGRLVDAPTPTPPGARRARLLAGLLRPPTRTSLTVIPTWGCNLRCNYCFVLPRLEKGFAPPVAADVAAGRAAATRDLVDRLDGRYGAGRGLSLAYIGGEPLLGMSTILAYKAAFPAATSTMTTNLAVDLDDAMLGVLTALGTLTVSLDGDAEAHDGLRKVYKHPDNPAAAPEGGVHAKVMANLELLLAAGVEPARLTVQGAAALLEESRVRDHLYDLIALGILPANIKLGTLAPTAKFAVADFRIPAMMRPRPCCDFRYMENFVVDGDTLRASYFHDDPDRSLLGPVDMPLDDLEAAYARAVGRTMPALSDDNCLQCPVVGLCWGHCRGHLNDDSIPPSSICDQGGLIALKDEMLRDDPAKLATIFGAGDYAPRITGDPT